MIRTTRSDIRIAVVCLSPYSGGMEIDAANLPAKLAKFNLFSILVCRKDTWLEEHAVELCTSVYPLKMHGKTSISASFKLKKLWRKLGVNCIIFFGSSEMPTLLMSLSDSVEHFIVRHGTTKSTSKKDFFHRFTWSKVTAHWCISKHIESNVRSIFPIGKSRVFTSYISIEPILDKISCARDLKLDDETFELVHVGRLENGKGQDDAIRAVSILRDRGIPAELTIIGDGHEASSLKKLAVQLSISEHIHFWGRVDSPYEHFDKFHSFLFPSHGEGLGNAFIEALASGMHCLSYSNTVFTELRMIGFNFYAVDNSNIMGLASTLGNIWHSKTEKPLSNISLARSVFTLKNELSPLLHELHLQ